MTPPQKKRCVGGGRDGEIITTSQDEQLCIREEGRPVPIGDGGQQRITEDLFNSMGPSGQVAEPRIIERLVLHPLCLVRQRQPASELLNRLDAMNQEFGEEIIRLTSEDSELRRALMQLVLDISDLAVSAIEADGIEEPGGFGITDDFLARAEQLVGDLRGRTTEQRLQSELDDLVDLARGLRGVPPSRLITALGAGRSMSS